MHFMYFKCLKDTDMQVKLYFKTYIDYMCVDGVLMVWNSQKLRTDYCFHVEKNLRTF